MRNTDNSGVVSRLLTDLRRPAGGWTMGILTLVGTLVAVLASSIHWIGLPIALLLLAAHLGWGAHGYYPRRV